MEEGPEGELVGEDEDFLDEEYYYEEVDDDEDDEEEVEVHFHSFPVLTLVNFTALASADFFQGGGAQWDFFGRYVKFDNSKFFFLSFLPIDTTSLYNI